MQWCTLATGQYREPQLACLGVIPARDTSMHTLTRLGACRSGNQVAKLLGWPAYS